MRISITQIGGQSRPHYFGARFMLDHAEHLHLCGGKPNNQTRITVRGNVVDGITLVGSDVGHYKINTNGSPSITTACDNIGFVEQRLTEQGVSVSLDHGRRISIRHLPINLVSPKHRDSVLKNNGVAVLKPKLGDQLVESSDGSLTKVSQYVPSFAEEPKEKAETTMTAAKRFVPTSIIKAAPQSPNTAIKQLIDARDMLNEALKDFHKAIAAAEEAGHPITVIENDDGSISIRTQTTTTVVL